MNIKKGTDLTLKIESLAFGGQGVARANGYVIFVDQALPGQQVIARVFRKKRGYAEARILKILVESAEAVEPKCPHFGECGGCRFQNLDYEAQLKFKRRQVQDSLEHIASFTKPTVLRTIPSPDRFYYRNKMEYSFGDHRGLSKTELELDEITKPKNFALGLHVRGRFDKILDIETCYLQSPLSVEILGYVRGWVLQSKIPPYSTRDHTGFWRHLVIREGKNTGDLMVNLVTADIAQEYARVEELAHRLSENFPSITTVVHNINRKKAQVAIGDEERVLIGAGTIKEKIGERLFQISANSFFQTNTRGAEVLYDKILELAAFEGDETVYDFYCGAGTITACVAGRVRKVIGFEALPSGVKDADFNAQLNGVENCSFVCGDLKDCLAVTSDEIRERSSPDVIIVDPPRAGMHARVLDHVLKLHPRKVVYVSCNPSTFARDAKLLCQSEYKLAIVQPVDMFPHTPHIEVVSSFERRSM